MIYDQADWTSRLCKMIPQPWAGFDAYQPPNPDIGFQGGKLYSLLYNTVGLSFAYHSGQISYVQLQQRIATATAENLDNIAADFFGANNFPRLSVLNSAKTGTVIESDDLYRVRIPDQIFAPKNTLAAIQLVTQNYIATQYTTALALGGVQQLALDVAGGLDTAGGLDSQITSAASIPVVYVFDRQSNPRLSGKIGLRPSQFCIMFMYGNLAQYGFFVGRTYIGRSSFLVDPLITITSALTPDLDAIIVATKAKATVAVYVTNRA